MVDRTLLGLFNGDYRLRCSLPNYDVKNAGLTPEQLSFDSSWSEIGNILKRGQFQISGSGGFTVYYGATYASPPMVVLHMSGPNNDTSVWYLIDTACWFDFNVELALRLDHFQVGKRNTNNLGNSQRTFRYTVMKNFYG
ncbi:hypothetical protein [uncultured Nitratireductor sp.]|uniref:hypothetical protein n=1 Tax=uncultured Nitratireductor sp. TaxID=520953 RepID=UPI002621ACAF|nr:hypothetical protein [uncultured Nitratireductor sp.]